MNKKFEKEDVYVSSVPEYINTILEKKKEYINEKHLWFRGHGSKKYELIPNLYRKTQFREEIEKNRSIVSNLNLIKSIEGNIDMSFSRKAFSFFNNKGIPDTHWYRYFLKQHYKVHTRLLDWTENALVALFFALEDRTNYEDDAEVHILLPGKLNNFSINKLLKTDGSFYIIPSCKELPLKNTLCNEEGSLRFDQLLRKYYWLDCEEGKEMYPIAVYPPHLDERMSAQQGCFTLFGNVANGLENNDSKEVFIDHIHIDVKSKGKMLKELAVLGINYYSVYPDLDGLGRSINDECYEDFDHAKAVDTLNYYSS